MEDGVIKEAYVFYTSGFALANSGQHEEAIENYDTVVTQDHSKPCK